MKHKQEKGEDKDLRFYKQLGRGSYKHRTRVHNKELDAHLDMRLTMQEKQQKTIFVHRLKMNEPTPTSCWKTGCYLIKMPKGCKIQSYLCFGYEPPDRNELVSIRRDFAAITREL